MASAATAVSAIGLLIGPVSAHALPPFPANAGCLQFKFMGYYEIGQNNGYNVHFVGSGQTAEGPAWARGPASDGSDDLTGTVSGGIQGRKMDFSIRWDSGSAGHYTADIDDEGFVEHGSTSDLAAPESHSRWSSPSQLGCDTPLVILPIPNTN